MDLDLRKLPIYSGSEASLLWGKDRFYVKTIMQKHPERFPEGSIRKIGKTWIVTQEGMETVTGEKLEDIKMLKALESLIGTVSNPWELDDKCMELTGCPSVFDHNGWNELKEQGSFAYPDSDPDNAFNIQFDVLEDSGEKESLLKVTAVDQL